MEWDGSGDSVVAAFTRWAAHERAVEAAETRSRERSLRDQAAGEATWSGLLVDLSEKQGEVALDVGGRRLSGRLVGVGPDFCVLEQGTRRASLVPTDRIVAIWQESPASGSRFPHLQLSFASALAALAAERTPTCLFLAGGSQVSGELVGSGTDLVTVRTDSATRRTVHVRICHIDVCELR